MTAFEPAQAMIPAGAERSLLEVEDLTKFFPIRGAC